MKHRVQFVPAILLTLALAACGGGSNNSPAPPQQDAPPPPPPPAATSSMEVLHASPDAPAVNVLVNGSVVLSEVAYKTGSGFLEVEAGELTVEVVALTPGDDVTVIGPAVIDIEGDQRISIIAVGETANIEALIITAPAVELDDSTARLRLVHAAPNAPGVDVYVTAPEADLGGESPLGTFSFGEDFGPVEVPADTYQIRVTLQGDPDSVVFDTGPVDIPAADLVIVAVQNTGAGSAPISLVALDGTESSVGLDVNTPAGVRVVHASPDAPSVDVIANDDFDARAVVDLAFTEFTDYLLPAPDELNVKVVPTGATAPAVIDDDLILEAGMEYTVLAVGLVADIESLVLVDDNRRVATEARIRLVHASPSAGDVDIYVTGAGTAIDDVEPDFSGVAFKQETGYVALVPASYSVTVTATGSKIPAIGPLLLDLAAGGIYTAIARDESGGGTPPGLILLDDLAGL